MCSSVSLTNVLIDTHVTTKTSKIFLYPRKLPSALSQPLVPSPQSPQAEAPSVLISVTIAYYCLFWNLLDIFLCVWLLLLSTVFEMCRCYLILTASPVIDGTAPSLQMRRLRFRQCRDWGQGHSAGGSLHWDRDSSLEHAKSNGLHCITADTWTLLQRVPASVWPLKV